MPGVPPGGQVKKTVTGVTVTPLARQLKHDWVFKQGK